MTCEGRSCSSEPQDGEIGVGARVGLQCLRNDFIGQSKHLSTGVGVGPVISKAEECEAHQVGRGLLFVDEFVGKSVGKRPIIEEHQRDEDGRLQLSGQAVISQLDLVFDVEKQRPRFGGVAGGLISVQASEEDFGRDDPVRLAHCPFDSGGDVSSVGF